LRFLLPIGLITLFAFAFGGLGGSKSDPTPITLTYTDLDNSNSSMQLLASLESIPGIRLEVVEDSAGYRKIVEGDRMAQLILYAGFEEALLRHTEIPAELRFDQSRAMEVSILQNLLSSRITAMQKSIGMAVMGQTNAVVKSLTEAEQESPDASEMIQMSSIVGEEEANFGLIQAVAGTAIMMLLFSVSAIGASIIEEKEQGVLKRLLQSPIAPFSILLGKLISACFISTFQLLIMFLFSWFVLGLDMEVNMLSVAIMILVTSICCASFGIFLASIASSKQQVDALGTIVILFMSAIGGSMIPLYIMPDMMQKIAVVSVNYWSIQGFYDIFWRKLDISAIWENVLVLTSITVAITALSFYFFKKNILRIN
jgi:ABC-type multidrug transport system permease subunit